MRFLWHRSGLLLLCMLSLLALPAVGMAQMPEDQVDPPAGDPGETFRFKMHGFAPGERVSYWVNAPDGTVIGEPSWSTRASDRGRADFWWDTPRNLPSGFYTMISYGDDSQRSAQITFQVAPQPEREGIAPPDEAETRIRPEAGPAGTVFDFRASGFARDERVGYWINGPDGSVISDPAFRTDANENGRADWEWFSPEDAVPGQYVMVARGDSGIEHTLLFDVLPR